LEKCYEEACNDEFAACYGASADAEDFKDATAGSCGEIFTKMYTRMEPTLSGTDTDNCGASWNSIINCYEAKDGSGTGDLFDSSSFIDDTVPLLFACLRGCFTILKAGLMNTILSVLMLL
jgi:hypothetical protein